MLNKNSKGRPLMIKRKAKKKDRLPDLIRAYDFFLSNRYRALGKLQKSKNESCKEYFSKYGCILTGCKKCCMSCGQFSCIHWDNCLYFDQVLTRR